MIPMDRKIAAGRSTRDALISPTHGAVLRPEESLALGIVLALGITITAWGLLHLRWPHCIPFNAPGLARLGTVLGGGCVVVAGMVATFRWQPFSAVAVVVSLVAVAGNAMWPLLVAAWFWMAAMSAGMAFRAACGGRAKADSVAFLTGAALIGTVVGLAAHLRINCPATYSALLLAPCLVFAKRLRVWLPARIRLAGRPATLRAGVPWQDVAVAVLALLYAIVALMPEVSHDALALHLFIPGHLATRGVWGFDAQTYAWAVMPMLGNWIFSVGYMLGGESGARLLNCVFVLSLAGVVRDLVLWGGGTSRGAAWAMILFLSTPLTFTEGSSLFVESVWACYVAAGSLLLLRIATSSGRVGGDAVTCSLLFGAALAAKAWSLVVLPPIVVAVVGAYPGILHVRNFRSLSLAVGMMVPVGAIPYGTAWLITGNPVFPFYNAIFRSDLFPPENFSDGRWRSGLSWRTIYDLTFDSARYLEARDGAAGFVWLAVLPAACLLLVLSRNKRGGVICGLGVGTFVAVFSLASYLRYVFPSQAFLMAAVGIGLSAVPDSFRRPMAIVLSGVVMLNCLFLNAGPNYYDGFPLESVLSERARQDYIATRVPIRKAVSVVNELNKSRSPVAVFGPSMAAGLGADALYSTWYNRAFSDALAAVTTGAGLGDVLAGRGVEYLIVDRSWGNPAQRAQVEEVTAPVFSLAGVSVRRMRDESRFTQELLVDEGGRWAGWTVPACVQRAADGAIVVTEPCHAYRAAPAVPGTTYRNAVKARCEAESASARAQVLWLAADGSVIRADVEVFECGNLPREHVMEVTAPADAVQAVVYACGHTSAPVVIISNSLRR